MADEQFDRKADDRMEFSTSKEVQVAPTFEAMHLKENLLRGYRLSIQQAYLPLQCLRLTGRC